MLILVILVCSAPPPIPEVAGAFSRDPGAQVLVPRTISVLSQLQTMLGKNEGSAVASQEVTLNRDWHMIGIWLVYGGKRWWTFFLPNISFAGDDPRPRFSPVLLVATVREAPPDRRHAQLATTVDLETRVRAHRWDRTVQPLKPEKLVRSYKAGTLW